MHFVCITLAAMLLCSMHIALLFGVVMVSKFLLMVGFCRMWIKNLGFGLDLVVLMNALYTSLAV